MINTAIIILAAGGSSRFGSTKQLLRFNDKTLLQHVIDEAVAAGAEPVIVVTGANANEVSSSIDKNNNVEIVFNNDWEKGMASGILAGIDDAVRLHKNVDKIILAICDQPFISATLFEELFKTQSKSEKGIVACVYADTIGTPVLFTQNYFDRLMELQGDEGAKKLLKTYSEDVATVDFPRGYIDIDTQEDYENLQKEIQGGLMI
jgi:molybdenum cofactor cytidylyltransferase